MRRRRIAVALAVVLVAGLASRRVDSLPGFLIDHAGDALWTTAVVLAIAFVFRTDARTSAIAGYGASVLVELSQLWQPAWLEDLRDNDLIALALGRPDPLRGRRRRGLWPAAPHRLGMTSGTSASTPSV